MRHFIVVVTLEAGHSVSGCINVPPVWDIGDAINEVGQIKERTTTKEEVLNLLGEPDWGKRKRALLFTKENGATGTKCCRDGWGQRPGI